MCAYELDLCLSHSSATGAIIQFGFSKVSKTMADKQKGIPLILHNIYFGLHGDFRKNLFLDSCEFGLFDGMYIDQQESTESLERLLRAFVAVGLPNSIVSDLLKLLAAIMHLSNIDDMTETTSLSSAARLLGVSDSNLVTVISFSSKSWNDAANPLSSKSPHTNSIAWRFASILYEALVLWLSKQLCQAVSSTCSTDSSIRISIGQPSEDRRDEIVYDIRKIISSGACENRLLLEILNGTTLDLFDHIRRFFF
jgi:hypothetical protein